MQGKRGGERAIIDYEEPMRRVRKKETEKGKRTSIEMMRGKERGSEREREGGGGTIRARESRNVRSTEGEERELRNSESGRKEERQEGEYGRRELLTVHCLYEPPKSRHTP